MNSIQVVELLARREGFEWKVSGSDPYEDGWCWHDKEGKFPCELPNFTGSLDALQPVLATLSRDELLRLDDEIWLLFKATPNEYYWYSTWLLKMKPDQLALCIAKAIEKKGEE